MSERNEMVRGNMKLEGGYHINETFLYQVSSSVPPGIQTSGLLVLSRAEMPPTASWTTSIRCHAPLRMSHAQKEHSSEQFHSFFFGFAQMTCSGLRISFRKCNNVSKSLSKSKIKHDDGPSGEGGGDVGAPFGPGLTFMDGIIFRMLTLFPKIPSSTKPTFHYHVHKSPSLRPIR